MPVPEWLPGHIVNIIDRAVNGMYGGCTMRTAPYLAGKPIEASGTAGVRKRLLNKSLTGSFDQFFQGISGNTVDKRPDQPAQTEGNASSECQ